HETLTTEVLAGASAWTSGDTSTARNRLRAAFESLSQARERFYPVDAYVIDLCLLDPAMPGGVLRGPLEARMPVTFLAPAKAIEAQSGLDPESLGRLREAITEGWADVVGGAYAETDEPLRPLESILWQYRHGSETYRAHLDGRNVETVARRRFALYPMLPQIGRRFGFRFAVHMGFDAGRFPVRPEAKRLWESPEHSNLEALTRPPLAADRADSALRLPWRLALSMRDDHVATLPLVRWPSPVAEWFLDLQRINGYSPVLARMVTLNDYFHLTDRPFELFGPEPDAYVTPYLSQAVARKEDQPVSRRAEHARLRARLDALTALRATAEALGSDSLGPEELLALELALETDDLDHARDELDRLEPRSAAELARKLLGERTNGRPGFLVINPTGIARRAAVPLPEAAADLRPEEPLRAAQFTEEGVLAVVQLPAFGFAWVPRDTNFEANPAPLGSLSVRDKVLRNESITVEIDSASGGVRGVKAPGEETARLGQQLVIAGLGGPSKMACDSYEVEYAGPALAQAVAKGKILGPDGTPLVSFRQRYRLWTGRPLLEIQVSLVVLDPAWFAGLADADPWARHLACRWAWPDPNSMIRRTALLFPFETEAERPETPDAIDVSTRRQRTALLFGGLAHHRKHGPRMLDTILLAGRERAREFHLGVALDLEHPFHAATDLIAPAYVVPTTAGPPKAGPKGWLYLLDAPSVAVTRVESLPPVEDGNGWGLAFHLLETGGQAVRARLRLFRPPTWARLVDFQQSVIVDLPIEEDAVRIDLTPHELARIEVTLG
ncbi:MAG: glycosyl hydrolase family 38, partial [Isosphaeraceae bacterium]